MNLLTRTMTRVLSSTLTMLFLVLFCLTAVQAEPRLLFEQSLAVEVSELFHELEPAEIARMFSSSKTLPQVVYATPDAATRVAFTLLETPFSLEEVDPTRLALAASLEARDRVVTRSQLLEIHGLPWFRLEYDSPVSEQPTREILLGSSLRGQLLFVMIATPVADLELMEPELEALIASLRDSSSPPPDEPPPDTL